MTLPAHRLLVTVASVLLFLLAALSGMAGEAERMQKLRHGWNGIPTVFTSRALKAGTVLDRSMLTTMSINELFCTSSVVKPDSIKYLEGSTLRLDLDDGAPVHWADLQVQNSEIAAKNCRLACERTKAQSTPTPRGHFGAKTR